MSDSNNKTVGVIGLGDMGLNLARNLVKVGFETTGFDLRDERLDMLEQDGGKRAASVAEVAKASHVVFVMVLNGAQVKSVISGEDGLLANMKAGQGIVVTATIEPQELEELVPAIDAAGINLIDSPVSGGVAGASTGNLILMAAGKPQAFEAHAEVLDAVAGTILRVGDKPGLGQSIKGVLQVGFAAIFATMLEAAALGVKLGLSREHIKEIYRATLFKGEPMDRCLSNALDGKFLDTGSRVDTIHKDVGISLALGKSAGLPMPMSAAAYQLFEATKAMFPGEDNWAGYKVYMANSSKHEGEVQE